MQALTLNPESYTLHPKPYILNPELTLNQWRAPPEKSVCSHFSI